LGAAHVNLGQLAHVRANFREAETHYREALRLDPDDALAAFNLGVVLEDTARPAEADRAYRRALAADPTMAEAHYNLALLCERRGQRREALRHLNKYRRLTKSISHNPGPKTSG
jgi:Flp pilus assembly protein TadD